MQRGGLRGRFGQVFYVSRRLERRGWRLDWPYVLLDQPLKCLFWYRFSEIEVGPFIEGKLFGREVVFRGDDDRR